MFGEKPIINAVSAER